MKCKCKKTMKCIANYLKDEKIFYCTKTVYWCEHCGSLYVISPYDNKPFKSRGQWYKIKE